MGTLRRFNEKKIGRVASIGLVIMGLSILWSIHRPMPLDHLANQEAIAKKFDEIVFGNDYEKDSTHLSRWRRSINLYPAAPLPHDLSASLATYSYQLASLSGLDIVVVNTLAKADIELHVIGYEAFQETTDAFLRSKPGNSKWVENLVCYFVSTLRGWDYSRGLIVIANKMPRAFARSCLLEELYQILGPVKNSGALRYSVSFSHDLLAELSLNDKLILRALYDDRLAPGMPRVEAMKIARQVIAELHAAVRAQGPDALIHPRHKARTAGGTRPN